MKINHKCVIELLEANDILNDYIDNYTPRITYYFGSLGQLSFDSTCIPLWMAHVALAQFDLETQIDNVRAEKCTCN